MKTSRPSFQSILVVLFFLCTLRPGIAFSQGGGTDSYCHIFKALLESGKNGFASIKGAETTRVITGSEKTYFISTTRFNDSIVGYINNVPSYPEFECVIARDSRISNKLISIYDQHKMAIMDCLSDEWSITEQDSTNNFYLQGTQFKKLLGIKKWEDKKMKFHLYMYSSMIEKSRIIELKIEGIGSKN